MDEVILTNRFLTLLLVYAICFLDIEEAKAMRIA
jgi:hypothetical protein